MLDRQSSLAGLCEPQDARTKPSRPLRPRWTGSRLSQEVTVQLPEQATSQNFGSPAHTSLVSRGITPQETTHKLLYEPKGRVIVSASTRMQGLPPCASASPMRKVTGSGVWIPSRSRFQRSWLNGSRQGSRSLPPCVNCSNQMAVGWRCWM
jgi:hypothetical protein